MLYEAKVEISNKRKENSLIAQINHYLLFEREKGKKTPLSIKAAAAAAT